MCGVTLEPTPDRPRSALRQTGPPSGLRSSAAADRTPPAVGRSALGAQTAKSACSLQDDARRSYDLRVCLCMKVSTTVSVRLCVVTHICGASTQSQGGLILLAVALYKLWQRSNSPQYARIVPSNDYDDLPDFIDTPPSPGLTHRLPSRSSDSEWQSIRVLGTPVAAS